MHSMGALAGAGKMNVEIAPISEWKASFKRIPSATGGFTIPIPSEITVGDCVILAGCGRYGITPTDGKTWYGINTANSTTGVWAAARTLDWGDIGAGLIYARNNDSGDAISLRYGGTGGCIFIPRYDGYEYRTKYHTDWFSIAQSSACPQTTPSDAIVMLTLEGGGDIRTSDPTGYETVVHSSAGGHYNYVLDSGSAWMVTAFQLPAGDSAQYVVSRVLNSARFPYNFITFGISNPYYKG